MVDRIKNIHEPNDISTLFLRLALRSIAGEGGDLSLTLSIVFIILS